MTTKIEVKPIYPIGRCNNCFWYFHESDQTHADQIGHILECPKCKTDAYLMDMPEIAIAVNQFDKMQEALELIRRMADKSIAENPMLKTIMPQIRACADKALHE